MAFIHLILSFPFVKEFIATLSFLCCVNYVATAIIFALSAFSDIFVIFYSQYFSMRQTTHTLHTIIQV